MGKILAAAIITGSALVGGAIAHEVNSNIIDDREADLENVINCRENEGPLVWNTDGLLHCSGVQLYPIASDMQQDGDTIMVDWQRSEDKAREAVNDFRGVADTVTTGVGIVFGALFSSAVYKASAESIQVSKRRKLIKKRVSARS